MEWSFSFEGALDALSASLDERSKTLVDSSLESFAEARILIQERAEQVASDEIRFASQGHIEGDNLVKDARQAPKGRAVRIHSFENETEFSLSVKAFDAPAG